MHSAKLVRKFNKFWRGIPKEYRLLDAKGKTILQEVRELESQFEKELKPLENWKLISSIVTSWFLMSTMAIQEPVFASAKGKHARPYIPEQIPFLLTLGAIVNHAIAVQDLCLKGLDVPAKQVLRSMLEYIELLILFDTNPALILEYQTAQTLEEANSFWHKNLKGQKARIAIENKLPPLLNRGTPKSIEFWVPLRTLHSQAATPPSRR